MQLKNIQTICDAFIKVRRTLSVEKKQDFFFLDYMANLTNLLWQNSDENDICQEWRENKTRTIF